MAEMTVTTREAHEKHLLDTHQLQVASGKDVVGIYPLRNGGGFRLAFAQGDNTTVFGDFPLIVASAPPPGDYPIDEGLPTVAHDDELAALRAQLAAANERVAALEALRAAITDEDRLTEFAAIARNYPHEPIMAHLVHVFGDELTRAGKGQ